MACARATHSCIRRARPLLGTFVEIAVAGGAGRAMEAAVEAAFAAVAIVHRLMSFHDPASDVGRLNGAAARAVTVDAWTFEVLEMAADLHARAAGAFDITVADALQRLGLLPGDEAMAADSAPLLACRERGAFGRLSAGCARSLTRIASAIRPLRACGGRCNSRPAAAIELLSGRRVRLRDAAVRIDLGGIAKGFAVDRAVDALRRHGMRSGVVNAGGDLAVFGAEARTIDIRDPRDPRQTIAQVTLRDAALASSAGRFDPADALRPGLPAIIDPRHRTTVRGMLGASVRAPTCMVADALTKALMVAPGTAPLAHYRASALLVAAGGEVRVTADWQDAARHAP